MSDIRQELVYDLYEAGHSDESANALLDSFAEGARAEGAAAVSAAVGDLWDRETNKGLAFVSPRIVPELRAAIDTDAARKHDAAVRAEGLGEHHSTQYAVYSDDGQTYEVEGKTLEAAIREARNLRTPDEDGYSEPNARVVERRICTWHQATLHHPDVIEQRADPEEQS